MGHCWRSLPSGIAMFRDCKTGGYNLEKTQVNERRLLAVVLLIAIAYTLATFGGQLLQNLKVSEYICRPKERGRYVERNSCFAIGLQAPLWVQCLEIWSDLVSSLLALKPHKRLHFHKGMKAISLIQSSL